MDHATPINDTDCYTVEMAKSLIDKVFFLDKVDAGLFVDFGCADGAMLAFIDRVFPGVSLVGFDSDEAMVERARRTNPGKGIVYTSSWDEVDEQVRRHRTAGVKSCLVLSSVIHEAHSYLSQAGLEAMWNRVWGGDKASFDYVAIRDMMVSRATTRPADPIQVARIRQVFDPERLDEWEAQWGSIDENWSMVHFLLTYLYEKNWSREVRENYLPVSYEAFLSSIPSRFFPVFKEHFTLPFLRRRVREDFGIDLADRTHLKLVLEATAPRGERLSGDSACRKEHGDVR